MNVSQINNIQIYETEAKGPLNFIGINYLNSNLNNVLLDIEKVLIFDGIKKDTVLVKKDIIINVTKDSTDDSL